MDRVFAVHAGTREFDSHRWHMSERFFRSNRSGYRTQCVLSWKRVVSEWRLVIAVSLNVGGGVRLIKPACPCARKTQQTQRGRKHGAGCARPWFRTAEPLGERRYENRITTTNWLINEVTRTMTKGEYTYIRSYIRSYVQQRGHFSTK